jgi:hypothetical protein
MILCNILTHVHKEEGSSNITRSPAETQTTGDSYEFIQIKTPLYLSWVSPACMRRHAPSGRACMRGAQVRRG